MFVRSPTEHDVWSSRVVGRRGIAIQHFRNTWRTDHYVWPVCTHFLPAAGSLANGSSLLASDPPLRARNPGVQRLTQLIQKIILFGLSKK